jgi:hypothetical protein
LHHAGFAVPSRLLGTRWALTPPFHPCHALAPATASCDAVNRPAGGFPPAGHRGDMHRRFIFCGTVRGRVISHAAPWRYQARCPEVRCGIRPGLQTRVTPLRLRCPDFPPGQPLTRTSPAITRPARRLKLYPYRDFCAGLHYREVQGPDS